MKTKEEIKKGLKEMETRQRSYILDMASTQSGNQIVYNTELIRKLEVTAATINALKWVLQPNKLTKMKT